MFGIGSNTPADPRSLTASELADVWFDHRAAVAEATEHEARIKDALKAAMEKQGVAEIEGERARVTLTPARTDYRPDMDKITAKLLRLLELRELPGRFKKKVPVKATLRCVARKRAA